MPGDEGGRLIRSSVAGAVRTYVKKLQYSVKGIVRKYCGWGRGLWETLGKFCF